MPTSFPSTAHDHAACRDDALNRAALLCEGRKARLTDIRRRVLASLWSDHRPVSAYDILARLNAEEAAHGGKVLAPPAVYRALEFLIGQGLVHRLASQNAYVGCASPERPHGAQFLICRACGAVAEVRDVALAGDLRRVAEEAGFALGLPMVEIEGLCPHCQPAPSALTLPPSVPLS